MLLKKITRFLKKIIYSGFFMAGLLISYLVSGNGEEKKKNFLNWKIIREIFYDIGDVFCFPV